jgi:hypothetical protein
MASVIRPIRSSRDAALMPSAGLVSHSRRSSRCRGRASGKRSVKTRLAGPTVPGDEWMTATIGWSDDASLKRDPFRAIRPNRTAIVRWCGRAVVPDPAMNVDCTALTGTPERVRRVAVAVAVGSVSGRPSGPPRTRPARRHRGRSPRNSSAARSVDVVRPDGNRIRHRACRVCTIASPRSTNDSGAA